MKRVMIMFVIIYGFMYGYRMTEVISEADKNYYMLVRGDGRNDGVDRLYLLDGDTAGTYFEIQEISYKGEDEWKAMRVCSLSVLPTHFCMGKVKGDDKERLYVTNGHKLLEYEYNNGWKESLVWDAGDEYFGTLLSGGCKNDGKERLYIGMGHAFNDIILKDSIIELEYRYGDWGVSDVIGLRGDPTGCIEGRNDDTVRLYVGRLEVTYCNNKWRIDTIPVSLSNGYIIGKGRGDGLNRMYVRSSYMGRDIIDEYTYGWVQSGKKWYHSYDNICGDVKWNYGSSFRIAIGEVRFYGKSRIYVYGFMYDEEHYKVGLIEYEWNGEDWEYNIMEVPEEVLSSCFYYNTTGDEWSGSGIMIIGKLRGDTGSVYILPNGSYYSRSITEWIPDASEGVEEAGDMDMGIGRVLWDRSMKDLRDKYGDIEVYDAGGRRVKYMRKGVYFVKVRKGNKIIKVINIKDIGD